MTNQHSIARKNNCMNPKRRRRNWGMPRGATAVEFAFAAPILLLFVFGAFELSRMSLIRNMAQDAAYDAARFCMVEGATVEEAEIKANETLAMVGAKYATVVINDGEEFDRTTRQIKVSISIPMEGNALLMRYFFIDQFVTAEISLNVERYSGFYNGASN
jgi:hypothetical protein